MSLAGKIAYNTITQLAGKIASTILSLFSLALITRYLGPKGFGEYTTILTFLGFFAVFADFGLTLVTVQLISDKNRDEAKTLNNLFALRLVSILIFLSIAPLISFFLPYSKSVKIGILIAVLAFIFPALNQVFVALFQKKLCMEKNAIAEIVGKLIVLIGVLFGEKLNLGLNGVLIATSIGAFTSFILHYIFSLKFAFVKLEWDFSLWKEIIIRFWPLAVTVILNLIYLRADTLILSLFKSSEEVGFYGAPYKIIDVFTSLPFMFAGLVLPILSVSWIEKTYKNFKDILQRSLDFIIIVAIPVVIGTLFVSQELIFIIAGKDFFSSITILNILIFSLLAIFPGTIFSHAVIAMDKQKKMIPFYIFTSISSVLAYLILIPKFSYYGAAAVTIYSEVLITTFSAYHVFKYSGFRFSFKNSFFACISGLIMASSLFLLKKLTYFSNPNLMSLEGLTSFIVLIFLAAIIYITSLLILGGIKKEDILIIIKKQKNSGGQAFGSGTGI